jgi:3-hydroxyisobutyrate dehydrogenase
MTSVAFIGLGAMGWPLAGHLARAYSTMVSNRSFEKAQRHAAELGTRAVSLEEAAEADVVLTCLPVSADVDAVARSVLGSLRPGTLWVDHTSGEPAAARETARTLAGVGVGYVDACLSGGVAGAQAGKATVMFGGSEQDVARAREVVGTYAATMVRVGDVGAGHAVKAVNNALLAANLWVLGEGLLALTRRGVDPGLALEVINASSGRSNVSENLAPQRIVTREFPNTFALGLLAKDVRIASTVLDDAASPAPVLRQVRELLEVARHELGDDVDHTAVVRLLEGWAGSEIR